MKGEGLRVCSANGFTLLLYPESLFDTGTGIEAMKGELSNYSIELSLQLIEFYRYLSIEQKEFVMSKQILRSGTSIGANIHEANYAVSKADFINKLQIAVKEAAETEYWLIILERSGFFDERFLPLKRLLDSTKRMLVSSLNTAKK